MCSVARKPGARDRRVVDQMRLELLLASAQSKDDTRMPFGRSLNVFNWKYAIGEVFLIVVGVSIALAASSWYEQRKDKSQEQALLVQFRAALQGDLEQTRERLATHLQIEENVLALVTHMRGDEPFDPDNKGYFNSLRRWNGPTSEGAPYEVLKNRGLELISNELLLLQLIDYYEDRYPSMDAASRNNRAFVVAEIAPYMMRNFRQDEPGEWMPLDYERLREDEFFNNLCMGKLFRHRTRIIPHHQNAIDEIDRILDVIDRELGN